MNRKTFLQRISSVMHYVSDPICNEALSSFNIKGLEAEVLYNMIKKDSLESELKMFIIRSQLLNNLFEMTEVSYTSQIITNLKIEIILDEYKMSDYGELEYEIKFNPNEMYDLLNINCDDYLTIYRVETEDGMGPYTLGIANKSEVTRNQPAPHLDGDISQIFSKNRAGVSDDYKRKWYFGFEKIEDIDKWFNPIILDVVEFIFIYKIKKQFVIFGEKQIIFKKEMAEQISRFI